MAVREGSDNKEDGYVFTTAWGEPIPPDTASSLMTSMTAPVQQGEPVDAAPASSPTSLPHVPATAVMHMWPSYLGSSAVICGVSRSRDSEYGSVTEKTEHSLPTCDHTTVSPFAVKNGDIFGG
jgi:hypothetical protein